jgi:fumarylacetoacetase
MSVIDETHDQRRESWVASARGHVEFPIQNLPFGVFSPRGAGPRGGAAIGEMIFDMRAGLEEGLFSGDAATAAEAAAGTALNPLMALGKRPRLALRQRLSALLSADNPDRAKIGRASCRERV